MVFKECMRKCDGQIVFQVSRKPLHPGVHLRRYTMHHYLPLITRIQSAMDEGPVALSEHLSSAEWQKLNMGEPDIEPGDLKMMIVLEAIFEQARLQIAPSLPSRMNCIFTWPNLESAERYRLLYVPEGVTHRCRVLQGSGIERDGGLLPPGINLADLSATALANEVSATRARAEKYWNTYLSSEFPELLIEGRVEVMDLVDDHTG